MSFSLMILDGALVHPFFVMVDKHQLPFIGVIWVSAAVFVASEVLNVVFMSLLRQLLPDHYGVNLPVFVEVV